MMVVQIHPDAVALFSESVLKGREVLTS
jgi:hypothetical protein